MSAPSRSSDITLLSFRHSHFGRYSSYHRLLHYCPDVRAVDTTSKWHPLLQRLHCDTIWHRLSEWRLREIFARRHRQCIHYLFAGKSLYRALSWKGDHAIVLTAHAPLENLTRNAGLSASRFLDALRQADRVIVLAGSLAAEYEEYCGRGRIAVIPHGVDVHFFTPPQKPAQERLVLTVGDWLRNYSLWEAVAVRVAREMPDAQFALVAAPGTIRRLRERVSVAVNVQFFTGLSDEALRELYWRASVLFLPLRGAAANNALLEAMACAVPLCVSDLPATREYAGECAKFFSNPDECSARLVTMLNEPNQLSELGTAVRRRAVEFYSWERVAALHQKLYAEVLGESTTPRTGQKHCQDADRCITIPR